MRIFSFLIFVVALLELNCAHAYIPSSDMILDRLVKNQGTGLFVLDLEVHIKSGEQWKVNKEKWFISDDGRMRMAAWPSSDSSATWKYNYIYQNGQKTFQQDKKILRQKVGNDFFEALFHERNKLQVINWMISQNIITNSSQLARKPRRDGLKFIYPRETHLRLGRSGGVIAYVFAKKDPSDTNQIPALWVEQDQFRIVKLRTASGATVAASNFENLDKLFFPGVREVQFSEGEVRIKLLKLAKMAPSPASKQIFDLNELNEKSTVFSEDPQIKQFYERFR